VDQEVQFWGKRAGHATTVAMATTRTTKQTCNHQSKLQQPANIVHWTPMDNVSGRLQLDIRYAHQELQFWETPLSEMKILPMGRRQGNKGPTCRNKLQGPVSIDFWYPKVNANRWLQLDIRFVTRERLFLESAFYHKNQDIDNGDGDKEIKVRRAKTSCKDLSLLTFSTQRSILTGGCNLISDL
jgi:hypothetical protein